MDNLDFQTDMSTGDPDTCSSVTDVQWRQRPLPGATRAWWYCPLEHLVGDVCTAGIIEVDLDEIAAQAGPYQLNLDKTACHELGHSVGMTHHVHADVHDTQPDYDDCMVSGPVHAGHDFYSIHHRFHVNDGL